jgi:hypothetical protein
MAAFCASHLGKLVSFLEAARGIVRELERIEVRCRELSVDDRRYEPSALMRSHLEEAIAKFCTKKPEIVIGPQFHNRQSHDRWLQFKVVESGSGASRIHRFT